MITNDGWPTGTITFLFTDMEDSSALWERHRQGMRPVLALHDALRVRMGIHSGEAQWREGDYYGTAVNRAARITGLAHGGQMLISAVSVAMLQEALPPQTGLRDLGNRAAMANNMENIAFTQRALANPELAAILLGAVQRIRKEIGQDMVYSERKVYENELALLKSSLPPEELDWLWVNGRILSTDAVIAKVMEAGSNPDQPFLP